MGSAGGGPFSSYAGQGVLQTLNLRDSIVKREKANSIRVNE